MKAPNLAGLPASLKTTPRWVLWKIEPHPKTGKLTKVPYGPHGGRISSTNAAHWSDFEAVRKVVKRYSGPGYVLGRGRGGKFWVVGLDLDQCLGPDGKPLPWAAKLIEWLRHVYGEISPSGRGLKAIFIVADADMAAVRELFGLAGKAGAKFSADVAHDGDHAPGVELYTDGRYFAMTGWHWPKAQKDVGPIGLDALRELRALLPAAKAKPNGKANGHDKDTSGSARALSRALKLLRDGAVAGIEDLRAALLADKDPEVARWCREKGDDRGIQRLIDIYLFAQKTSHSDLALGFVERHKDDLRYVAGWGQWIIQRAAGWQRDMTLQALNLVHGFCRETASGLASAAQAKEMKKAATIMAVQSLARACEAVAATTDQWDRDDKAFSVATGMVDLRTGVLRQRMPEDYALKCAGTVPSDSVDCPLWLSFLDKVTGGDRALQDYLQRLCGYCLTGNTDEHSLAFFYGTGRNGKGTFLGTLLGVMGQYAVVSATEVFTASRHERHSTELAMLHGARLVVAQELDEGKGWNEARIKALTGGDPITARFMRQDDFTFIPKFKLLISGNYKPSLRSVDPALRARIHLIPFLVFIAPGERILDLKERLKTEYPGILRWMIQGCLAWQQQGLRPPACVLAATEEYFAEEDTFGMWLEEKCHCAGDEVDGKPLPANVFSTAQELFGDWKNWCEAGNFPAGSMKGFANKMMGRFEAHRNRADGRGFVGLRLKYNGSKKFK